MSVFIRTFCCIREKMSTAIPLRTFSLPILMWKDGCRDADLTFFTEFMDDASFVKLNERVAQKGNHIPRGKDVVVVMIDDCPEVTKMDWTDDNFSLQFPYARLWLRHVGRRERAAVSPKLLCEASSTLTFLFWFVT